MYITQTREPSCFKFYRHRTEHNRIELLSNDTNIGDRMWIRVYKGVDFATSVTK